MIWDRIKIHQWCTKGLPIVYCQLPFCGTMYLSCYVAAGSFAEGTQHGLAHCVEHMLVRRTALRAPEQLHMDIGLLGANNNAFTSTYRTNFFLEVIPRNLEKALVLLNEMLWKPSFQEEDWNTEKNVIMDEMNNMDDSPFTSFFDKADARLFNSQAGHSIIGTARQVDSYGIGDMEDFYRRHYGRNTATLVVVGSMPLKAVQGACLVSMDSHQIVPRVEEVPIEMPLLEEGKKITFRVKGQNQCYIMVTMKAPGILQEGSPAHFCALQALGGDTWSMLFKRAREKQGLCYSINAFSHHLNPKEGSSLITAECAKENVRKVLGCIRGCIEDMGKGRLSRNLCRAAKAAAEMQMHEMLSNPEHLGEFIGSRATFGMTASPIESYKSLRQVKDIDIRTAAVQWCHTAVSQATLT